MSKRKHIALTEVQEEAFKEAKLLMQQEKGEPDLDDNETVRLLANYYITRTWEDAGSGESDDETETISE